MFRVPTFDELQKETSYIRLELTGQLHNPCLGTQRICIVKRNQLRGLTKQIDEPRSEPKLHRFFSSALPLYLGKKVA